MWRVAIRSLALPVRLSNRGFSCRPWFIAAAVAFAGAATATDPAPWERMRGPADGRPQVYGAYTAGCLAGAAPLIEGDEAPYVVMRPSRRRQFGHPTLVRYLDALSRLPRLAKITVAFGAPITAARNMFVCVIM